MTRLPVLTLVVMAVVLCAAPAVAGTVVEISGTGYGDYTFSETLGVRLSGCSTGLIAWQVTPHLGTPVSLPGATLCFTSGPATSLGPIDTFGPGGFVTITGGACGLCFFGVFAFPQYDIADEIFSAPFIAGYVSPEFSARFGLPYPPPGGRSMNLTATLIPMSGRGGLIGSTDFSVIAEPEPSSIALLASGLLLGGLVRRKFAV